MESSELPVNLFSGTPGRVHVMGICGAGAAGVAWMLHMRGWQVSGCDLHVPPALGAFFARAGIQVFQNHNPAHLAQVDAVVYSAAVHEDNAELKTARAAGLRVLSRGECLAGWVSVLRSVAVCGTHGKTTTSCFATRLLQCVGEEPFWCLGGYTPKLKTSAGPRHGQLPPLGMGGTLAVAEADESDGTLAYEHPAVTVITNIDLDHLDHFHSAAEIEACFSAAVEHTRERVAVCADAARALRVASKYHGPILTYGLTADAMVRAADVRCSAEASTFTLLFRGRPIREITLPVPGQHNVQNALGALAACVQLGFDPIRLAEKLPEACAELPKRRFQWLTPREAQVRVVMDYAHHPNEIQAVLSVARLQNPRRLRVVFQPHRYSRTKLLMSDFVLALDGVQEVVLLPVFAASEKPLQGGCAYDLYAALRANNPIRPTMLARNADEVVAYMRHSARPGDLVLVVGAGDVERVAQALGEQPACAPEDDRAYRKLNRLLGDSVNFSTDVSLARYSFYRTGGRAEIFAEPTSPASFAALSLAAYAYRIPLRMLGCGSNSWFPDGGISGVVCSLSHPAFRQLERNGRFLTVGAGMVGAELLQKAEQAGLSGLEFMAGIPGTVGGWAQMNAGAHGRTFWELVSEVRMVTDQGQVRTLSGSAFFAGYREVKGPETGYFLEVTLELKPEDPSLIAERHRQALAKRADFSGLRCCGSLFRNPERMFAGKELEQLGAKSMKVGGAFVSPNHANVIAAGPGCTSSDLLALMLKLRACFTQAKGFVLIPEVTGYCAEEPRISADVPQ